MNLDMGSVSKKHKESKKVKFAVGRGGGHTSSIRQIVNGRRQGFKYYFGLKGLLWRIKSKVKIGEDYEEWLQKFVDPVKRNDQYSPFTYGRDAHMPILTQEEQDKFSKALSLLEEVFEKNSWNENTQLIIKKVEEYDRSK